MATAALPAVSLVVLNYDGLGLLGPCLDSLERLEYPSERLELIVCDNGSRDGSIAFVRSRHPRVRVVELDRNYGFAEGNNRAAAAAGGELVGFLNNDMRVEPSWLARMVAALQQHGAGCVSSKILSWDGSSIDFAGAGLNVMGFGFPFQGEIALRRPDEPRRIMCPCGGAMLLSRELFLEIGGFDADYFAFYEDTDLGWRLNLLGHDVWYVPDAVVYHHHHGTASRLSEHERRFLYERNALHTMYKCLDDGNLAAVLPAGLILLNERSLEISRADRDAVRPDLPRPPRPAPLPPLGSRISSSWTQEGMGGFTRRTQAFIGRRVSGRWRQVAAWWDEKVADRFRRPPPDQEEPRDPLEPLAAQVAMAEFARDLERLRSKREWLQSRRVRTDSELLPLFHFALEPSLDSGTYLAMHRLVLGRLGLTERFAAGQLHVPVAS